MSLAAILIIVLFVTMIIGLISGEELAFVLGGVGVLVGWYAWGSDGLSIAMTRVYNQGTSYSMIAIPMFVLMANFLTHSKVADGLFESIRYLLGPLKGGLGLAVIVVSTIFAATTGIVGASVVTMGMLSVPILLKFNYNKRLSCGMVCAGGSLGILIPPSIMLVTLGTYAEVSVGRLFFAAIIPGLVLALAYMIYILVVCHIFKDWGPAMSPEELAAMPFRKRVTGSLVNLVPPLILIFAVLGSIFAGIATPTEAAGMGALFSLILAICYKQFSWKMMFDSLVDTAKTTAMVFIILFGAAAFTAIFMSLNGDDIIIALVESLGLGKWGALLIFFVIVFIMGSIMLVTLGTYAEVSVGRLFFAAIIPGLVLALAYMIYILVVCHIFKDWGPAMSPEELAAMPFRKRVTGSLVNLVPPLILIFAVLGSIFAGIATPTEAAGMGALFSLILAICYKQFSWKMMFDSLVDTAKTTAMVFIILFGAAAFTAIFMSLNGDDIIIALVESLGLGKWGALLIFFVIVFIMGCFLDWTGIVMICMPIFLPIMDMFGFDRLWLCATLAVLMQTCFMTPPFGFALFYIKGILPSNVKISDVYYGVIPFIIAVLVVTLLCVVFPGMVTWLPTLVVG